MIPRYKYTKAQCSWSKTKVNLTIIIQSETHKAIVEETILHFGCEVQVNNKNGYLDGNLSHLNSVCPP